MTITTAKNYNKTNNNNNINNHNNKGFICIHCTHELPTLYKRYDNSIKPVNCNNCHKVADEYIEFEPIIVFIDTVLLSEGALRHVLYNRDFKLHWKLSLILLLLESFAMWRCHCEEGNSIISQRDLLQEQGFCICCLQNICDYALNLALLLLLSLRLGQYGKYQLPTFENWHEYSLLLLKALALASFSKFFLLPILVWRQNATNTGAYVHRLLVLGHHLVSLICVFTVIVNGLSKLKAALMLLPLYFLKEQIKNTLFLYIGPLF